MAMSSSQRNNNHIVGCITHISNENKKKKYYIKFTLLTENNETIEGWVFSPNAGILTTPLGQAMTNAMKTKTGIKLWGSLEENEGSRKFCTQTFCRYQTVNLNCTIGNLPNNFVQIQEALMNNDTNCIRCYIIAINPPVIYENQGITINSTFILIGDDSGTTYLAAMNLKHDQIKLEQTYTMTNIRKKFLNGSPILSTTIDTNFEISDMAVSANIDHINETLAMDLTDVKTIRTTISEVSEIQRSLTCNICSGTLKEHTSGSSLLVCEKCRRYSLKQNNPGTISTSIVLKNEKEKIILYVKDEILKNLMNLAGVDFNMNNEDIIIALISNGNLIYTFNGLTKQLLNVENPE